MLPTSCGNRVRVALAEGRSPDADLAALDRCLEAEEQLDRNANHGDAAGMLARRFGVNRPSDRSVTRSR